MVLPLNFFAPLPLAIMLPFMAMQSFFMGQGFGYGFQFSKRRISSLTNAEFNALTVEQMATDIFGDMNAIIPKMNLSFQRMEAFQIDVLKSMGRTVLKAIELIPQFLSGQLTTSGTSTGDSIFGVDYTDVRRGSEQFSEGGYDEFDDYLRWRQEKGLEVVDENNKGIKTGKFYNADLLRWKNASRVFENLPSSIPPTTRFKTDTRLRYGGSSNAIAEKKQLEGDIRKWRKLLLAYASTFSSYQNLSRRQSTGGKAKSNAQSQMKKARNIMLDLNKKINNNLQLLKNPKYTTI